MNNLKSSEPINLLGNIEMVIELSENSRLSDEFYEKAKPYIDVIKSHLQLSDMAALFFSIFVDNDNSSYTSIKDLSQHLDCRKIRIMQYGDSLHELEKRRLIRCRRRDNEVGYRVPSEVFYALTEERAIEPWQNSHLSQEDFFSFVNDLFKERKEDEILYPDMVNELKALVYANPNLELCKIIRKSDYAEYEKNLLLYFCNILVNDNEDQVIVSELESIFEKGDMSLIKMSLRKDNNRLLEDKWIEKICFNGFSDGCWFKLTDKAKQELVGEEILQKSTPKLKKNIIQHNTIVKKELFFDEYEQEQIDKLTLSYFDGNNSQEGVSIYRDFQKNKLIESEQFSVNNMICGFGVMSGAGGSYIAYSDLEKADPVFINSAFASINNSKENRTLEQLETNKINIDLIINSIKK